VGALEPAISNVLVVCWWRDWDEEKPLAIVVLLLCIV